jgi:hypothetical protein
MSSTDRTCATSVALDPNDQTRLFRITTIYLCAAGDLVGLDGAEDMPRLEAAQRVRMGAEQAMAAAELIEATLTGSLVVTERVRAFLEQALSEARECLATALGYLAQVDGGEDPFAMPPALQVRSVPLSTVRAELVEQVAGERAAVELLLRVLQ